MSQEEIEALLMGGGDDFQEETEEITGNDTEENFEDILAGIDGMTEDDSATDVKSDSVSEPESVPTPVIKESQYDMPIANEHKVVNQLNEVAEDSEEKASQIFDVLSFILDENGEIDKYNKQMAEFISDQEQLLESLSEKFPKIDVFKENLETAKNLSEVTENLATRVNDENNKIFEAMELMQYHDINRQKIERVMAVIKKLTNYLNGIFEDNSGKPEVQIAQHISGDSADTVDAEDIESLISEFSN